MHCCRPRLILIERAVVVKGAGGCEPAYRLPFCCLRRIPAIILQILDASRAVGKLRKPLRPVGCIQSNAVHIEITRRLRPVRSPTAFKRSWPASSDEFLVSPKIFHCNCSLHAPFFRLRKTSFSKRVNKVC